MIFFLLIDLMLLLFFCQLFFRDWSRGQDPSCDRLTVFVGAPFFTTIQQQFFWRMIETVKTLNYAAAASRPKLIKIHVEHS